MVQKFVDENKSIVNIDDKEITVSEYFKELKSSKKFMTDESLLEFYNNCLAMKDKFTKLNQVDAMKKLIFLIETVKKEKECLDLGINTYVHRDSIDKFITSIRKNEVSFIELCRYERVIPDDVAEKAEKVQHLFDNMYVLFTDYSRVHEKKYKKEVDPILFGTFEKDSLIHDRFYYIGDWVDEYCDLTLEKFIEQYKRYSPEEKPVTNFGDIDLTDIHILEYRLNSMEFNRDTGKYELKKDIIKHQVGREKVEIDSTEQFEEKSKDKSLLDKVRGLFR